MRIFFFRFKMFCTVSVESRESKTFNSAVQNSVTSQTRQTQPDLLKIRKLKAVAIGASTQHDR